jgi:hypothetical protein
MSIDISIHNGVDLDKVINTGITRTPSSHYFSGMEEFLKNNPDMTPFVVEFRTEPHYLHIVYKRGDQLWTRHYRENQIIYQMPYGKVEDN